MGRGLLRGDETVGQMGMHAGRQEHEAMPRTCSSTVTPSLPPTPSLNALTPSLEKGRPSSPASMAATISSSSAASAAASAAAAVLGPLARLLLTAGEGRPMGCISKEDRPPRSPTAAPAGIPAGASADSGRPPGGRLLVSMRAHLTIQLRWLPPDRDEPLAVPALSWYLLGRDSRLPRLAAAPSAPAAATAAAAAGWSVLLPSCTSMAV